MESAESNPGITAPAAAAAPTSDDDLASQFATIMESTEKEVFGFILKRVGNVDTAWELTQDTFVHVWEARDQYDASRDSLPWVFTIARNVVISHHRHDGAKKRGRPISFDQLLGQVADDAPSPEPVDGHTVDPLDELIHDESIGAVDRAAGELGKKDRELYALYRARLTIAEIAERTGRTTKAIGPALTRLWAKLRQKLSHHKP